MTVRDQRREQWDSAEGFRIAIRLFMAAALATAPAVAFAGLPDVELDGNAVDDPPGYADDWDNIAGFNGPPGGNAQFRSELLADPVGGTIFYGDSRDVYDI